MAARQARKTRAVATLPSGWWNTSGKVTGGRNDAPIAAATRITGDTQRRLASPATPIAATTR